MSTSYTVTLKDGSQKTVEAGTTYQALAKALGLAKVAVVAEVEGALFDLSMPIDRDAAVAFLTIKDEAALEVIRHSCAHLLAQAIQQLYPGAKLAIGPVIEHGFYYDFDLAEPLKEEDLPKIASEMKRLASAKTPIERRELSRSEAIDLFQKAGESYKVELVEGLPEEATITVYQQGDFVDLCRGPHVPHTGFLKAFQLTAVAGAYWRGDVNQPMLQRVYGTAWGDGKSLQAHLTRLEEAKKRDHRVLAKKMDLFHMQEDAPGMVFWHPNGWTLYKTLVKYISRRLEAFGYQIIRTPVMASQRLWALSGHAEKFGDDMFFSESEGRDYAVKPMSCPLHIQVYNQKRHSYRDLPVRLAEFGCCHRNEPSGSLHGLMRVRAFVQDDAHIFCTPGQVMEESQAFIKQLFEIYKDFGFSDVLIKLSTRPEKRVGDDAIWDKAEQALAQALDRQGVAWEESPGEGAFYGPKIEFSLKDSLDRVWQCGTLQLDFFMPERLSAIYIDENGDKQTPVMLHRAYLGTFERFMAILLEHHAGQLPAGLAPVQVVVMNITDDQADYVRKITEKLKKQGVRAQMDLRNEKIGFKIRNHTIARVPFLAIVGSEEMSQQTVALRTQQGEDLGQKPLDDFVAEIVEQSRRLSV